MADIETVKEESSRKFQASKSVFRRSNGRLYSGMFDFRSEIHHHRISVKRETLPEGAPEWIQSKLGFLPDGTQKSVLGTASKRVLLNCTRQWGKSTVTAARAV